MSPVSRRQQAVDRSNFAAGLVAIVDRVLRLLARVQAALPWSDDVGDAGRRAPGQRAAGRARRCGSRASRWARSRSIERGPGRHRDRHARARGRRAAAPRGRDASRCARASSSRATSSSTCSRARRARPTLDEGDTIPLRRPRRRCSSTRSCRRSQTDTREQPEARSLTRPRRGVRRAAAPRRSTRRASRRTPAFTRRRDRRRGDARPERGRPARASSRGRRRRGRGARRAATRAAPTWSRASTARARALASRRDRAAALAARARPPARARRGPALDALNARVPADARARARGAARRCARRRATLGWRSRCSRRRAALVAPGELPALLDAARPRAARRSPRSSPSSTSCSATSRRSPSACARNARAHAQEGGRRRRPHSTGEPLYRELLYGLVGPRERVAELRRQRPRRALPRRASATTSSRLGRLPGDRRGARRPHRPSRSSARGRSWPASSRRSGPTCRASSQELPNLTRRDRPGARSSSRSRRSTRTGRRLRLDLRGCHAMSDPPRPRSLVELLGDRRPRRGWRSPWPPTSSTTSACASVGGRDHDRGRVPNAQAVTPGPGPDGDGRRRQGGRDRRRSSSRTGARSCDGPRPRRARPGLPQRDACYCGRRPA